MALKRFADRANGHRKHGACELLRALMLPCQALVVAFALSEGAPSSLANEITNPTPAPEVGLRETESRRRPGSGYKFVARNVLAGAGEKYDGQQISTYGEVGFKNGVVHLSDPTDASNPDRLHADICIDTPGVNVAILRRLTSLGVGVWGIYRRAVDGNHNGCRNGSIKIQSLEVSFE